MMLGQIRSLNLHLKNFANTIHARRCPVEKHGPVCLGSLRARGKRNIVVECKALARKLLNYCSGAYKWVCGSWSLLNK